MEKIKVLLDTDIGSDIDDALCLAYLLSEPRCELAGITTVTGMPEQRAMLASAICKMAGKKVPIFPGLADPIEGIQKQPHVPHTMLLSHYHHDRMFADNQAIEFLGQTIRQNPGEIVLLGIGPMTNIATLFTLDPSIPSLLKSLVLMCGTFGSITGNCGYNNGCEWNAFGDPLATSIVYNSKAPFHRSIGLNVTSQLTITAEHVYQKFTYPLLKPLRIITDAWFKQFPYITFHDPLAAVSIFHEDVCTYDHGIVTVETEMPHIGATSWHTKTSGHHHIASSVDSTRFFRLFYGVFEKHTPTPITEKGMYGTLQ